MKYDSIDYLAPWCALNRIFGFAPRKGLALARHFGGAGNVFSAGRRELQELLGGGSPYLEQIGTGAVDVACSELERLKGCGDRFLCIEDERYPELLRECDDAPAGLYLRSASESESIFNVRPAVAVVGTRDITSYGTEWCTRIVDALSRARIKPLLVSGLAIGTDITAQNAALARGLPTLSVMATGIDEVYPFRHGYAAEKIRCAPGSGLVTDYPPQTRPRAINFLRRNRIIAGMCGAVVLVESKRSGGGLMTCRLAYSYNRDVYALPGRVDDVCSGGCNSLIRMKMAEPIDDMEELVDALGLGMGEKTGKMDIRTYVYMKYKDSLGPAAAEKMASVADAVRRNRDIRIEDIGSLTGIGYADAAECSGRLICDGIIVADILQCCSINPEI